MTQDPDPQSFLPFATVLDRLKRARGQHGIDALAVQTALGLRSLFLAERLLAALGGWRRRFETPEEFVTTAQNMMAADISTKIEFLFNLHDIDGDGWIRRDELERLIHIALAENDVRLPAERADQLVDAVMGAADRNNDQKIGGAEFVQMMISHPQIQRRLADYGVSLLMPGARARRMALLPGAALGAWVRSAVVLAGWLIAFVGVNAFLFMEAVLRYQSAGANTYVQIARGCGACLNFNAALVVLPMLRHTLTWVRRSFLGRMVPVDSAVGIHGLIGEVVVLFSLVHAGAHLLNARAALTAGTFPWNRTNTTGAVLLLVFAVMWLFSRRFVRRSGRFELFHVTHLGYFAALILLFAHGPNFWMWGTVPWVWYLGERVLRARHRRSPSRVVAARSLPSRVTRLDLRRPRDFDYSAGDYVFLCVPKIARHEWHPFTLTSAPGDRARLTVHMRSVGNWTSAVADRVTSAAVTGKMTSVRIDGPYGSASRHIFEAPHAVAIGAGIGVTPFASILQSLLQDQRGANVRLQKLRFVWLCRDQHSFEWFADLLSELEKQDRGGRLDIHIFMTGGRADMAGGVLDVARHELRAQQKGDIVTGLRSHTTFGAPDFDRLLEGFYRSVDLPRPQVFFCGPAPLGRTVARSCRRLGLRFRSERF